MGYNNTYVMGDLSSASIESLTLLVFAIGSFITLYIVLWVMINSFKKFKK